MNPFTFIDDLAFKKEHLLSKDPTGEMKKEFSPFLTAKHFSNFKDTIFYSNEMNMCPDLDKEEVYDFFFYIVPPKKRFAKWNKKNADSKIELIQEFYGYSRKRALDVQYFLNEEDMTTIKEKLYRGGTK